MEFPEGLKYTKEHEWIRIEGGVATIGITDYAQHSLGDVVFLELPAVGSRFEAGAVFGVVESVKAVSDLYAPVGGEVTEINDALVDAPEGVNEDPYGGGWMIRLKMGSAAEAGALMDQGAYAKHVKEIA